MIGGDFFEHVELPSGGIGIALGDVSGKGPPAALLTFMLQGILPPKSRQALDPLP
jgi:sigma-B regulation protein RsbU (phosphoserine phosphatase)